VRADANLTHAVENLVDGSFFNSGQSCCGVERIYVHADVYDRFVEGFVENAQGLDAGQSAGGRDRGRPMATGRFADLVRGQTLEALRKGATAHLNWKHAATTGGLALSRAGGADRGQPPDGVMREESFGPVVGIMKVPTTMKRSR
jgi:acyl-CoA reductase-like NAD-dependent aldehyde dehydrogenase